MMLATTPREGPSMGLFGKKPVVRYQMRQDMISIGDDYWVEDSEGNKAFHIDGKAARLRDTWVLENSAGKEVALIREKKMSVRDAVKIEVGGKEAVVKRAMISIRDRFHIEVDGGEDLKAKGNFLDHEYEIEQDGDKVAEISKKWFRLRDTYGVEIYTDVDPALILSITVAIDSFSHD
jgi:uncharacterized protein YxjI